ncbi:hypothetical protein, conserved [Eimeria tenella]|uniref:Uncharacterized protein n=1 Tax=Eimeria tenella TaxID=5802 RepID=H9B9B6_EIMTE|nr:hypothetical protein, conserved [Eimeria tenella]AET50576.1 hypothetical protein [Eimeria tenella]CDJ42588.1 hypothetical protein, conserved [Eimeria tenella]|eukprot:XP_013233338.1 hypothetical protein, conserved [Eimeria tenella]
MNGCSKRASCAALRPSLSLIPYGRQIRHWEAAEILRRMRTSDSSSGHKLHPCMDTWSAHLQCLRRFPHSAERRCRLSEEQHQRCLKENGNWRPTDSLKAMKILELFKVYAETKSFKYPKENVGLSAAGAVVHFPGLERRRSRNN